ncbi:MAG: DUF1871 family protein [Propionibacteriaceae bacterium]|jgi:hypothetical protein|nr:DUF1871 family protein [Propionibacteriaceae bacterium]
MPQAEQWRALFSIVKRVIDEWNPYSLLPDAPSDEFDQESRAIAQRITKASSITDIAHIISEVFSRSFEPESFPLDRCLAVAESIKTRMPSHRLITDPTQ